jgi:hypothetical protein
MVFVVIVSFEANGAASNSDSGKVFSEAFHSEKGNGLVFLENRSIMEDMSICARAVVARVVSRKFGIENGKGCVGDSVVKLCSLDIKNRVCVRRVIVRLDGGGG